MQNTPFKINHQVTRLIHPDFHFFMKKSQQICIIDKGGIKLNFNAVKFPVKE